MNVIIGVDPHKTSHTAVALDGNELDLGEIRVRANSTQLKRLLAWAEPFGERTWAVEGAGGCGYLLSQQLVAAGETVLNVPATLAARVRVLGSGRSNKNDPNDARSVAIAALRAPGLAAVAPADHASVLRLLARRHHQLTSSRTRTACRLHALLTDLIPGGSAPKLKANRAQQVLDAMVLSTPVEHARAQGSDKGISLHQPMASGLRHLRLLPDVGVGLPQHDAVRDNRAATVHRAGQLQLRAGRRRLLLENGL